MLPLGILGLLVTAGVTIYDQRNTQIYDRLVVRLKVLERELKHLGLIPGSHGGLIMERSERRGLRIRHRKLPVIWHDLGLAIVYAASAATWTYITLLGCKAGDRWIGSLIVLAVVFVVLLVLAHLNDHESEEILACWRGGSGGCDARRLDQGGEEKIT